MYKKKFKLSSCMDNKLYYDTWNLPLDTKTSNLISYFIKPIWIRIIKSL